MSSHGLVNIYCDESCHLENDGHKAMILGAVTCPTHKAREIAVRLREIKTKHGLSPTCEVKWTKVSPAKVDFYQSLVDYFFDDDDLSFRGLVIPDKSILDHEAHEQTHDGFYYKMYFDMLKVVLDPACRYRVYIDIKDTRGAERVEKLHQVLSNSLFDFRRSIVERMQVVRSHDIEQMQLADLLIGALGYVSRGLTTSTAKHQLVARIQKRSGYSLKRSTLFRERKFNVLVWQPRGEP